LNRARVAALALLLLASSARAADPPCIAQCREMAAKKQLRAGMTEQSCVISLCQQEGRRLYKEGEYDKALESYAAIANRLEKNPIFHIDRGDVFYAQGRFDQALGEYDKALEIDPFTFQGGAERAHTLMRLGRWPDAREQFAKLLDAPSAKRDFRGLRTASYLQGNLGVIDVITGDVPKGKGELEAALKADGHNSLASTYIYRVLPQLEKKNIDAHGIALLLYASEDAGLGRRDASKKAIDELVEKYPKFPETYFLAAELYRNAGYYEVCERVLTGGERAIPDDVDLKAERLRCTLLKVGVMTDEAKQPLAELKRLGEANPDNPLVKQILEALKTGPPSDQ
jgi:tetratricopeptide (TPR) repeat protein